MKILKIVFCFTVILLFISKNILPASIDGTTEVKYLTTNQVFHNNEYVRGYVTLNSGATILSDATAFFNINTPLKGGLDLRSTGTLSLEGDLYFDSNVTLSGSGIIRGNGKTIFLSGNLTIPANSVIHINSDTIIDGQGKDLIFGRRGRIFVDTNITLTLRNMKIVQNYNDYSDPCIRLAAFESNLALDNVELALSQDFLFSQGQLFIHGDVAVTGTSAFIYQSTQHAFITPDSEFYFDNGTTFSVTPATFTDCRFDQWPTYTSNSFVLMSDKTSRLQFNESSLYTTPTGSRFTKGTVIFENKCFLKSNSVPDFPPKTFYNLLGQVSTESLPNDVAWSPNGSYLAVVNKTSNTLQIFDSVLHTQIGSSVATENAPVSVSWNNYSNKLAVVNSGSNTLQVFSFNGVSTPTLSGSTSTGTVPSCCAWSTWNNFIAVVNSGSNTLQIFNSSTLAQIGSNASTGNLPSSVSWAPGDQYLAVVNAESNTLQIFSFYDYSSTPVQISVISTESYPSSVSWDQNATFIAVANKIANSLQIFTFGSQKILSLVQTFYTDQYPVATKWSYNTAYVSNFVAVVNYNSSTIQLFSVLDSSKPIQSGATAYTGFRPFSISWSPSGNYIAVVSSANNLLQVFPFSGTSIGSPYPTVFTGGVPRSVSWSPDEQFIAVIVSSGVTKAFPFNNITGIGSPIISSATNDPQGLSWSQASSAPNYYIAVAAGGDSTLYVFPFTGAAFGTPFTYNTGGGYPIVVSFSPSGNFIALGDNNLLRVFPFSESGLGAPYVVGTPFSLSNNSIAWSPDGNFITTIASGEQLFKLFRFDGSSSPVQIGNSIHTSTIPYSVSWSKDGRYITVGGDNSTLQTFSFNGFTAPTQVGSVLSDGGMLDWSPNSKFVAFVNRDEDTLKVSSMNPFLQENNLYFDSTTQNEPISLSWSPDNSNIAVVSQQSNELEFFELNTASPFTQICYDSSTGGNDIMPLSLSPDGRFIAVGANFTLYIYPFNGTSIGSTISHSLFSLELIRSISWSPDGKFISVGVENSVMMTYLLYVFPFTGSSLGTPSIQSLSYASSYSIAWSPDGKFIATSQFLNIYPFYGTTFGSPYTSSFYLTQISWSPDGRFIAGVNKYLKYLEVLQFNGSSVPTQVGSNVITSSEPAALSWSPDGRFIAVVSSSGVLQIYSFNGTASPKQIGDNISIGFQSTTVNWSPDGRFIVVGTNKLKIYSFNGSQTPAQIGTDLNIGSNDYSSAAWSKDGQFIAVVSDALRVFRANYIVDKSVQSISNGVVFGNLALGSSYDATVNLLAGANVNIDGLVNYDCVN